MKNKTEPLLFRPHKGDCELYLPFDPSNRRNLKKFIGKRSGLIFNKQRQTWSFKRAHFSEVLRMINQNYPLGTVIVDVVMRDRCDERCIKAKGTECNCGCGGANHGGLRSGVSWTLDTEDVIEVDGTKVMRRKYRAGYAV